MNLGVMANAESRRRKRGLQRDRKLSSASKGRRNSRPSVDDEPFYITFCKVGLGVATVFAILTLLGSNNSIFTDQNEETHRMELADSRNENTMIRGAPPPLIELGENSLSDAFGIVQEFAEHESNDSTTESRTFLREAETTRIAFATRYGGIPASRSLLEQGVTSIRSSSHRPEKLAAHFRNQVLRKRKKLKVAVFGSSSAAGYGNFHDQAYSFVLKRILRKPLRALEVDLQVENFSMQAISEFPLSLCVESLFGENLPDILIYDYAKSPGSQFESFLRLVGRRIPFLIVRDPEHIDVLQYYTEMGTIREPMIVQDRLAARPWISMAEDELADGFRNWDHFDAPGGNPDKTHKNCSPAQHELIGWLIGMRLLSGFELAVLSSDLTSVTVGDRVLPRPWFKEHASKNPLLRDDSFMNGMVCYTSYEWQARSKRMEAVGPKLGEMKNLKDLVLGNNAIGQDSELLLPKSAQWYTSGWAMDLDMHHKRTKQRSQDKDFLGFRDWKKAFYGVPQSGTLSLLLPTKRIPQSIFVCPSLFTPENARDACLMSQDVSFSVGGTRISPLSLPDSECVQLTSSSSVALADNRNGRRGLVLELNVSTESVSWRSGPCSIAFVLYKDQ